MSIKNLKFKTADFSGKDISSLPDRPGDGGITGQQLKERFDQIPKMMVALGGFNDLIDELNGTGGAANIGISSIDGVSGTNAQAALAEMGTLTKAARTAAETAAQQGIAAQQAAANATAAANAATAKATAAESAANIASEQGNEAAAAAVAATAAIIEVKGYAAEQAQSAKDYVDRVILEGGTVTSVFGRAGEVKAQAGDYTADMVGARPNTWLPTAEEVGARPNTWTPNAAEIGAAPSIHASQHASGGADPIIPAIIGAVSSLAAIDISNQNLITAVGGKSGFFRGNKVANAPSENWYCFISAAGNSQTSVIAISLDNGQIRSCKFGHSGTSINWRYPVDSGGGTMSGNLTIERTAYPGVNLKDTTQGRNGTFQYNENEELLFTNTKDSNYRTLMFLRNENNVDSLLALSRVVDGTWTSYKVLHTGNMISQGAAVIKKGSYTGTNVYGSGNKNSLKFDSKPKMLFVKQRNGGADFFFAMADNLSARSIHGDTQGKFYDIDLSWSSDGTVTWYSTVSAYCQLNQSGNTYDYIAIL